MAAESSGRTNGQSQGDYTFLVGAAATKVTIPAHAIQTLVY